MDGIGTFAARMVAALALSLAAAGAARAEAPGEMRFRIAKIMDQTGFEKPLVAGTSAIPADWTEEGGIVWRTTGQCTLGATANWAATSPDGKSTIRLMPNTAWQYNNSGNPIPQDCMAGAFNSADDYVRQVLGSQLQNMQIVDVERDPQLSQVLAQQPFSYEMPGDPYARAWWDAASVTFTYRYEGEAYTATLILVTMHNYMMSGQSYGFGAPMEFSNGATIAQILLAAPTKQFTEQVPAFLMFLKNYQPGAEWQARMDAYNARMAKDRQRTNGEISKIISDTYSDISDMSMQSWRKQNQSSDYTQRETSEWMRDVETYDADTPTGQIELPSGYDRAFQLNDDTFVVTNDAFYEPFRDSGIDGRELTASK